MPAFMDTDIEEMSHESCSRVHERACSDETRPMPLSPPPTSASNFVYVRVVVPRCSVQRRTQLERSRLFTLDVYRCLLLFLLALPL